MKISGFTYVRNGIHYQYPYLAAIQSILPIVDEMVVVVGDSTDGTRESVEALNEPKIKIVDTVWDENNRKNGKIFSMQSNAGILNITGDWGLHIQADEVIHEDDVAKIKEYIELADNMENVDGLLFPFYHFWGDYSHIRDSRKVHDFEVRAFKNNGHVFSFKDSQGFRFYPSYQAYLDGDEGKKLRVLNTNIPVYHYSYVRNPKFMKSKIAYFRRFWHTDQWINSHTDNSDFDYNNVDKLILFEKSHPIYMKEAIAAMDWSFSYDPSRSNMGWKQKVMNFLEKICHRPLFRYANYELVALKK